MSETDPDPVEPTEETEIDDWNAEDEDEVSATDVGSLVVYSRDWTVETILTQIGRGNIDLNPNFQRRNAWNDLKRSKLIESLIIDLPVPEIVLAEDKDRLDYGLNPSLSENCAGLSAQLLHSSKLANFIQSDQAGVGSPSPIKGEGSGAI